LAPRTLDWSTEERSPVTGLATQIEDLRRYGETRKAEAGEVLFRAGDASNDFIVVLEGEVKVVDDFAGEARTMGVMRAGRFVGELNMLTGQAMYLSGMVGEGGDVLALPSRAAERGRHRGAQPLGHHPSSRPS
jgi:CRP-like cAMP-binding protein